MRMKHIFKRFYPKMTKHFHSVEELQQNPPQSDILIVGSDQVWNHKIERNKALAYYLDFGTKDAKRISYASSFGLSEW